MSGVDMGGVDLGELFWMGRMGMGMGMVELGMLEQIYPSRPTIASLTKFSLDKFL